MMSKYHNPESQNKCQKAAVGPHNTIFPGADVKRISNYAQFRECTAKGQSRVVFSMPVVIVFV